MSKLTFSSSGTVYGDRVSRKEEDNLKLEIDRCMKHFHPFVDPSTYRWVLGQHTCTCTLAVTRHWSKFTWSG